MKHTDQTIVALRKKIPRVTSPKVFDILKYNHRFLWHDSQKHLYAFGTSSILTAQGSDRFTSIEQQTQSLSLIAQDKQTPLNIPLIGGFSFAPKTQEPWEQFGDAQFIVPRICYEAKSGEEHAYLWITAPQQECISLEQEFHRIDELLSNTITPLSEYKVQSSTMIDQASWNKTLALILEKIQKKHCQKIVAAVIQDLTIEPTPHPTDLFCHLDQANHDVYRFSFTIGHNTFLGASPETLIRKQQNTIFTEALAGSLPTTQTSTNLQNSQKDRHEHQLVIDAIERTLRPLCHKLDIPETPRLRCLPHITHLQTPIVGTLSKNISILALVQALHPTPAVAGSPQQIALDWIASYESIQRGWYAAPIGWFDSNGDGTFAVAIRSGLLINDQISLYLGAGIVQNSDPDTEYNELLTKQKNILSSIGIS